MLKPFSAASSAGWNVFTITKGQTVSIDDETGCSNHDNTIIKDAIHIVSVWAISKLGQSKVDDKSNEITPIPEMLQLLNVNRCIVTIDEMGCQKKITRTIRYGKANSVLVVKENHERLRQDTQSWLQGRV